MSTPSEKKSSVASVRRSWGHSAALVLLLLFASVTIHAEPPQHVQITNFPELQKVQGTVKVAGAISHTQMVRLENKVVSPVNRSDYTSMREIATLNFTGFSAATLSLVGELKGTSISDSRIGVLLLPDESRILRTFRETGDMLLSIELYAEVSAGSAEAFAVTATHDVAFPRYRAFLYNEGSTSAELDVYAYMSH